MGNVPFRSAPQGSVMRCKNLHCSPLRHTAEQHTNPHSAAMQGTAWFLRGCLMHPALHFALHISALHRIAYSQNEIKSNFIVPSHMERQQTAPNCNEVPNVSHSRTPHSVQSHLAARHLCPTGALKTLPGATFLFASLQNTAPDDTWQHIGPHQTIVFGRPLPAPHCTGVVVRNGAVCCSVVKFGVI